MQRPIKAAAATPNNVEPVGSLMVVGCGIIAPAQVTNETRLHIERADRVFSLVADPVAAAWLESVNPRVESLAIFYEVDKPRRQTYDEMVATIVSAVRTGEAICAVSYGHPGVFAYPLHESIRQVRALGFEATMLPAVSAEDCLFAELGIDPAQTGACSFEATDFLIYDRHIDLTATIILWQIGVIGERSYKTARAVWNIDGVHALVERLELAYGGDHEVIVYEAARLVTDRSTIIRTPLRELASTHITTLSTLVIPPAAKRVVNRAAYDRLVTALK